MSKTKNKNSQTIIESMAKQVSHLKVENVNSDVLQQFSLSTPYMIFLETCREKHNIYRTYQISPLHSASVQFDADQQKHLLNRPQHKHSFIEIMYVLSGAVTNRIENQSFTYTQGQCCVMNSNICHCESFEGDFQIVFFMFQNQFLQVILDEYCRELQLDLDSLEKQPLFQLFHDTLAKTHRYDKIYLDCLPLISPEELSNQLIPLFNEMILETTGQKAGYSFYIKGAFTRFFHLLNASDLYSIEKIHSEASQKEYLATKIIHVLEAAHGHCTRQQLTRQLHYSAEYLNRIFKTYTGKTISEYRQFIFLKEGKHLLANTNMSISDIITTLGFSNRSYFYRLFEKEFGLTPMEYRQKYSTK